MDIVHQGKFKHVKFTFAVGDLLEAKVDAIVSSEQTDFVLSGNPQSISGQIWCRYGDLIQQELDEITKSQVLCAGTVIDTSGGKDFKRIFHAGFHKPDDWPGMANSSQDADYFEAIGSCVGQVLESVRTLKLSSVAFPLIGCGIFGLDEKMLILQFLEAIESLDGRLQDGEELNVWLVIRDPTQFRAAAGKFLELLLAARREMVAFDIDPTSVPILDRFASRFSKRSNEDWAKWQLCRFTEIAVEIMCYGLGLGASPPLTPESQFLEGESPTFGRLRELALELASGPEVETNVWGHRFFTSVLKNETSVCALEEVNSQRNNLAHGRMTLSLMEIRKLVAQSLQLDAWARISETDGEFPPAHWKPWVMPSSTVSGQIGIFERWQKHAIRYLVPETGEVFKIPRRSAASVK